MIQRSEVEALLEMSGSATTFWAIGDELSRDVMAELCRTWLAVQEAAVTPISEQVEPFRKPLSEIDWPDFRTTYARVLPCDESGRLVPNPPTQPTNEKETP